MRATEPPAWGVRSGRRDYNGTVSPGDDRDFGDILAAFERQQAGQPQRDVAVGDKVEGRIVGFGEDSAFVDLGLKAEGIVPLAELTDAEGERTAAIGDTVEALVTAKEAGGGAILLRVRPGRGPVVPAELAQAQAHGFPVEGSVQAVVKGGVEVTVSGIRAFCPISQLDLRYVEEPAAWVGQRLQFRILRYEEGRGRGPNIVLSRRALLEEEARRRAAETRAQLAVGKVVRGTVTSLTGYGAFVDLGGLEGLLHVSEMGYGRVEHPQDVLAAGQEIEVEVVAIEPPREEGGQERISLSRRSLLADPWEGAAARLAPGSRHPGRVVRLESFGAFVELAPGVEGLLHVSEMGGDQPVRHPREAVRPGDELEVTVLTVDRERRRISLSLAPPAPDAADMSESRAAADSGFGAMADFFARGKKKD
ncbi:MAG TPA: S1 RNA-binding domain-containing protein [Thermoanaerobaculia bacterium]|nr:S1 RNA-binding domain-containing protein [Thermoanaerobaculia bacterium]